MKSLSKGSLWLPAVGLTVGLIAAVCIKKLAEGAAFRGQTVLITGGSRGLGLELARTWASQGARVAICARTAADVKAAVNELRGNGHEAIGYTCDVGSEDDVNHVVANLIEAWDRIDVLVNNAGIIQVGPYDCMTLQDYRQAMDTHLWGPLYMIRAVLPHMLSQGKGSIVNIASIGGKISVPHLLPYSASKFALVGLSEGLHAELAKSGIRVTTVCPGLMRTGSPRNALFKGQHRSEYAWFSISGSMPLISIGSQAAARQIVRACRLGRAHLAVSLPCKAAIPFHGMFPGLTARLLSFVNRWLPAAGGIGRRRKTGEESASAWSPSPLTWLNEQAAARNNEVR